MPARNAERTLPACLRALQDQTIAPDEYEIIVVDDGSTDATAVVARTMGACVASQAHQGPAAARNLGVSLAQGELIMFTDADCAPAHDWLEQMSAPLQDETITGVKGAYATRQTAIVARLVQLEFAERYARLSKHRYVDFFDTHALALRQSALQAAGPFDTFFPAANNEDVDLAYRLAARGYRLVFNPNARVYHQHPDTWRGYLRQKFWRGYWRMQVYQRYPHKMLADTYTPQALKLQVALVFLLLIALPFAWWLALACGTLLLASGVSLFRLVWRHDRALLPFLPFFLFARALAIGFGSALGALTILRIMPLLLPRQMAHEHTRAE